MTCIIIEDQRPAQEILEKYIRDIGTLDLLGVFTDALQALPVLKENTIDIVFLDIHLPKLSGIDFLKTLVGPSKVILTTAFPDYALESYELDVVDYLLKPFSFQRFVKAVSKIQDPVKTESEANQSAHIFIKSGYEHIRLDVDEIHYLKADADYTEFISNHKKHVTAESLKHWEVVLKEHNFIRIHKSYIVNRTKVTKVSANSAYLLKNIHLPIGRTYKEDFLKKILK